MIKQQRILLMICGFILIVGLALWPAGWSPRAYANVTLVGFTATTFPGQPEIFIEWETATERGTVGFFIVRSDSATGDFVRVSDFIPHEGNEFVGAQYGWPDEDTVLGRSYWYKLEEITQDQTPEFYGPITITAGALPTDTPTPSRTPTPTPSRTPTATPTTPPNAPVTNPTGSAGIASTPTVRVVAGATVTPQPISANGSSSPPVSAAVPTLVSGSADPQQPVSADTSAPSVLDTALGTTVAPPRPAAGNVAQASAPTLVPADAVPAVVAPVVVATEAVSSASSTDSNSTAVPVLIAAALLFLGIAFVILRQARQ